MILPKYFVAQSLRQGNASNLKKNGVKSTSEWGAE